MYYLLSSELKQEFAKTITVFCVCVVIRNGRCADFSIVYALVFIKIQFSKVVIRSYIVHYVCLNGYYVRIGKKDKKL